MQKKVNIVIVSAVVAGIVAMLAGVASYWFSRKAVESALKNINSEVGVSQPPPAYLEAIDKILDELPTGNVIFNSPNEMQLEEPKEIRLLLSAGGTLEELKSRIGHLSGPVEGVEIKISESMEARLSGLGFRIEAITPEIQTISSRQLTEWRWEIEPRKVGALSLHLTISVIFDAEGRERQRVIRVLDRRIKVKVRFAKRLRMFIGDHWEWLVATIILPLLVWLRSLRRREAAGNDDEVCADHEQDDS